MRRISIIVLVAALLVPSVAAAQSGPASEHRSRKGRIIGVLAGAGGGFLLGLVAGFAWYDDAINSDRKVTTTVVAFSAAGAVGGYLIGNAIDKRSARTTSSPSARLGPPPMLTNLPKLRRPPTDSFPWMKGVFMAAPEPSRR